jgi:hypothetical protein
LRHRHGAHPERQSQNNCQIPHGRPPSSATVVQSETRCAGWQMVSERAAPAAKHPPDHDQRSGAPASGGSPVRLGACAGHSRNRAPSRSRRRELPDHGCHGPRPASWFEAILPAPHAAGATSAGPRGADARVRSDLQQGAAGISIGAGTRARAARADRSRSARRRPPRSHVSPFLPADAARPSRSAPPGNGAVPWCRRRARSRSADPGAHPLGLADGHRSRSLLAT